MYVADQRWRSTEGSVEDEQLILAISDQRSASNHEEAERAVWRKKLLADAETQVCEGGEEEKQTAIYIGSGREWMRRWAHFSRNAN